MAQSPDARYSEAALRQALEDELDEQAAGKMNTLATLAMYWSFFAPPVGIVCGHIALAQIKKTGESGRGFAKAGLGIGYVGTLAWAIVAVLASLGVFGSA